MRIKEILSQSRRDFRALYECEHCGKLEGGTGYDDEYFHRKVIPEMECKGCGKKADENYRPLAPLHHDGVQI
jgi:adenylylsulfate kinase-like enzyme